jgi:hypothetical protein
MGAYSDAMHGSQAPSQAAPMLQGKHETTFKMEQEDY